MRNLLEFLAKYSHVLLFILLEVICMALLFRFNDYQGSVFFTTANAVAGKVYEWRSEVENFFAMSAINEQLTERNILLERQVLLMEERLASAGDTAFTAQLAELVDSGYSLIPAKVISNSLNRKDNLMTIDKGSVDGVRKDMGVVCGNGVAGIVYLVSANYSIVIPVLNGKSNISVAIRKRGYYGYLHWTGGNPATAYVDDIPRHARFSIGDDIVTSGYSAIFPPGVLVGKVLHVYNSDDGLSYRIEVKLSTDFGNLRDVCVISDSRIKEQAAVMRAARDSLAATHR